MQSAIRLIFTLVWFISGSGCATKTSPDPLAGWKGGVTAYEGNPYGKAISEDYLDYIQKLPPREKKYVQDYSIRFYEDGTGRRAVKILIPFNGIWWEHVLIYDKNDRRVQTMKRIEGRYRS